MLYNIFRIKKGGIKIQPPIYNLHIVLKARFKDRGVVPDEYYTIL